ncbi:MAG: TolC family protein [Phycisphaerales bacterium]|nr:TolC family protein [Phycisphaerales bacterium]
MIAAVGAAALAGCSSLEVTDRDVAAAIAERQRSAMQVDRPVVLAEGNALPRPDRGAYLRVPSRSEEAIPEGFEPQPARPAPTTQPPAAATGGSSAEDEFLSAVDRLDEADPPHSRSATAPAGSDSADAPLVSESPDAAPEMLPTSAPTGLRETKFTLSEALAYALRARREYQTAKEDLYLAALALTLERHLWTPQFAANLRTTYGNFGEIRDFDQAMRWVAELSMAQRLPYGGEFTARAISTLVRDVGQTITAEEGSSIELGLNVPLLRNAGHVAREDLVRLERQLTYAVRDFERFRRAQLVDVASAYFDLLRAKQDVLDAVETFSRFQMDYERAQALEEAESGTVLDTRRAETELLSAENRLEDLREAFRAQSDTFKLLIGMPVDEALEIDDLEDIETIENEVAQNRHPLLVAPPAATADARAIEVATASRLDLLNRRDQIDDAKRGVLIAENQLLPDLDWTSSLTFDTDPAHYKLGGFEVARATWRTEVLLSLPLERTRERNELRTRVIDVHRARRTHAELLDRVRSEVRRAVNQLRLEDRSVEIQVRNVAVADLRREYARIQFYDGDIGNRDLIEAENDWRDARNRLNLARTSRWGAILNFRLATETLRVADDGRPIPAQNENAAEPASDS